MIDTIFSWMLMLPQFWLQVMWVGSIIIPFVVLGIARTFRS